MSKMDPHSQFRTIIDKWIGMVALMGGLDLSRKNKKTRVYTVVTVAVATAFPFIYFYTIYKYDGDLRFSAIAYFGAGIQVSEYYLSEFI